MAHAAMQSLIAQMQEEIDEVMLFSTELVCEEHRIDSDIIMMPEVHHAQNVCRALGKPDEIQLKLPDP